ncbi:MAG: PTS sugar transporter subunit IIA [Verrucomicrobiales bacterium]|jgi:mannitol/fructose-specific phosphotransferase system IIA component (Ntr-type)|nr:PTS sugar transporter subunit IIA [Verrucomicrobiales bacterium]
MRSLLDALQDGRLIELPDNNKIKALEYLATLIEAIPDIGVEGGITESVLAREHSYNTGIGKGWACPHARSMIDGQLLCAVGWSPSGIDYGAADGEKIHIVVMYYVPDTQKNAYLKEISSLAKAIQTQPALQDLKSLTDLAETRHRLLDAISAAAECTVPEAKARMIQLEVKHSALELRKVATVVQPMDFSSRVIPLSILAAPGIKSLVLSQDRTIVNLLEGRDNLAAELGANGQVEHQGLRILLRASSNYQPDRVLYDCLAIKLG